MASTVGEVRVFEAQIGGPGWSNLWWTCSGPVLNHKLVYTNEKEAGYSKVAAEY